MQEKSNHKSKRFAVIGHPLTRTLSPFVHDEITAYLGTQDRYDMQDVEAEGLSEQWPLLLETYDGLNVTRPHKTAMLDLLSAIDEDARLSAAVNTVDCQNKHGYNTDVEGARPDLGEIQGKRVLLIGNGVIAETLARLLLREDCKQLTVIGREAEHVRNFCDRLMSESRSNQLAWVTVEELREAMLDNYRQPHFDLLVNATSAGRWPHTGELPLDALLLDQILASSRPRVFDVVYNPAATRLVLRAKSHQCEVANGLGMLWRQAILSRMIWQPEQKERLTDLLYLNHLSRPQDASWALEDRLRRLGQEIWRRFEQKVILIGFVGSGKGAVAGQLPLAMGCDLAVWDLDEAFEKATGERSPQYQRQHGEAAFRQKEREVLQSLVQRPGSAVIAAGAGTVIQRGVASDLHEQGVLIVWLNTPLHLILERFQPAFQRAGQMDPDLSSELQSQTEQLYYERLPLYREAADLEVLAEGNPRDVAWEIAASLGC